MRTETEKMLAEAYAHLRRPTPKAIVGDDPYFEYQGHRFPLKNIKVNNGKWTAATVLKGLPKTHVDSPLTVTAFTRFDESVGVDFAPMRIGGGGAGIWLDYGDQLDLTFKLTGPPDLTWTLRSIHHLHAQ